MDPEFRTTFLTNCDGLEEIGHGGFGKVYKYINENGESFAIKKMYQKLDKNTQTNFRKEVSTLRKLNHPNIVKTYGAYTDGSSSYIIFEYLSGGELFQRLSKRKVYTEKDARAIMKILLDTVKYIHSKGIVHRDLKIENILLSDNTEEAIIKIADFGLAADLDSRGLIGVVGTTYYSAPEVHKSEPYNEKVDIWSLGVICYVLLSGTYPFTETRNEQTVICNIRRGQYQFHDKHWNKVSKAGKDFVRKLLVVKPEGRLSVDEALDHEWFSIPSIELVASIYSFIKKWRRITRHRAAERKKLLGENNEEEEDNTEQQQAVDDLNDAGDEDDDETTTNNVAEDEDNNHQINANEPTLSGITTTSEIHHHDDATPLPVDHLPALLEGNSSGTSNHVEGLSAEVLDNTEEEEEEEELKPVYSFQISNNKSPKEIDEYEIYGESKTITTYWEEYTGLHKQDNIEVTVDVYDLVKTPAYLLKNLQNEISLLSCLKIPTQNHMVKYYGTHYKQNKLYIVKEKLYGKEILGRINDMSLKDYNESNIKIWVHDLFHVIHDLHQQNVVHRAILPENIRFTSDGSDGELVLINFQQAKRLHPPSPTKITSFTSPDELEEMESLEQAKAKDMWSLGVLLHLLFIGSTPFSNVQKKDLQSTIKDYKGIDFQHKDTVTQWECISKDGKDLIKRLLEKNPLRRLTIIEACRHPWLAGQNRSVGELKRAKSVQELIPDVTLHHIRRLYILRKFRRTVRVMIFFVRVLRGLGEVLLEKKLARENNNNNDNRNDLLLENNNNEMIEIPLITPPPPPSTSENPPPAPSEGVISPIIRSFVNQFFFRSPGHDSPGSKQQT